METELKFRWRGAPLPTGESRVRLFQDEWLSGLLLAVSEREMQMDSRYYDTPDGRLKSWRGGLRIREEDERRYVTIKLGRSREQGLHQRLEWTAPLEERDDHDFSADPEKGLDSEWFLRMATSDGDPDDDLRALLQEIGDRPLVEICRARFRRIAHDIGYGDTLMEIALDEGELSAGELRQPLEELEIEIREGDVRDLIELGDALVARYPLEPETESKLNRCLRMIAAAN